MTTQVDMNQNVFFCLKKELNDVEKIEQQFGFVQQQQLSSNVGYN